MRKLTVITVLFSLFACITNYVPLSLGVIALLPLAVSSLCYHQRLRFFRGQIYLLLLFSWIMMSVLLYNASSLQEFDFYRKDGNFFISYTVLLVLLFIPFSVNIDTQRWTSWIFAEFFLLSCIGFFLMPGETTDEGKSVHHFFFVSHNAAGGFYSVIAAVALGIYLQTKKKGYLFFSTAFLFFLYESDSRGSLLAIIVAAGYALFGFKKPVIIFLLFLLVQFAVVLQTYPEWVRMGKVMSEGANFVIWGGGQEITFQRAGTFIDRLYFLWPRALDNILHSPVAGLGFGSFDDLYYHYIDAIPHVLAVKDGAVVRHSDSHAHNSTLTLLAELGVVGYALFLMLFNEILKSFQRLKYYDPVMSFALTLAFWTCVFSSATEHRITTPSQMVPFFILAGMSWLKYPQLFRNV
ncbi:O-antigen ligase family protein [Enterobacter asburiae]|uniref:O-antigen ligase family protein n=1 Tax=Enterobacter asburiae TaxID=61645 RepID=UPI00192C5E07|nr:O-antigen ligase family protein [Enterobacter asburiae]MBL5945883.1 O-antigen ligase family protein [Enterobacter asburiae]MBL5954405.1 O-antigen ligase family protein [Enterobacter asburiae]